MGLLSLRKGCWSPEAPHLAAVRPGEQRSRPKPLLQGSGDTVPRLGAWRPLSGPGLFEGARFQNNFEGRVEMRRRGNNNNVIALLSWDRGHGLVKFKPENNNTGLKPRTQDFSSNPARPLPRALSQ